MIRKILFVIVFEGLFIFVLHIEMIITVCNWKARKNNKSSNPCSLGCHYGLDINAK